MREGGVIGEEWGGRAGVQAWQAPGRRGGGPSLRGS